MNTTGRRTARRADFQLRPSRRRALLGSGAKRRRRGRQLGRAPRWPRSFAAAEWRRTAAKAPPRRGRGMAGQPKTVPGACADVRGHGAGRLGHRFSGVARDGLSLSEAASTPRQWLRVAPESEDGVRPSCRAVMRVAVRAWRTPHGRARLSASAARRPCLPTVSPRRRGRPTCHVSVLGPVRSPGLREELTLLALAGCSNGGGTAPPSPRQSPAATGASPVTARIVIKDFAFSPTDLQVRPGTQVTVTNRDSAPHTVTATGDQAFDTGSLAGGATTTFAAPSVPGSYPYLCTVHPRMTGRLTVT
ncbi:cupredoxin domain-containing protein [Streptomyces sp. NPDC051079]|uniref:cupredoxin domain-containing protein n=1 Tax=Streptomyces sp. NPDC051079 TaxID=3155043 RepID=UPI00344FC2B3